MRTRLAVVALFLIAACGEAAPQQNFVPLADQVVVVDTVAATTTTTNPEHQIDPTARNPFEQP